MTVAAYGLGIVVASSLAQRSADGSPTSSAGEAFYINISAGIVAVILITRFVHDPRIRLRG
jgi:hypothetical protein